MCTSKGNEIRILSLNDTLQELGGVEIGTELELGGQHVPAPRHAPDAVVHVRHLQDLEGAVGAEPEGEIGDLLDAHRFVPEEQLPREVAFLCEVNNCDHDGEVEERVFWVLCCARIHHCDLSMLLSLSHSLTKTSETGVYW